MQYPNYLSQIAALIRENPSITVREIADKLQFADNKSVYYWLSKSNVNGINEFKRLVLAGENPLALPPVIGTGEQVHYAVSLPLFAWDPKQKNPVGEWHHLDANPNPQGLFAVTVGSDRFSPWFVERDVLIISQREKKYPENAWVLLQAERDYKLARVINGKFVNPTTLENYSLPTTPVGTVIKQIRSFYA